MAFQPLFIIWGFALCDWYYLLKYIITVGAILKILIFAFILTVHIKNLHIIEKKKQVADIKTQPSICIATGQKTCKCNNKYSTLLG